MTSFPSKNTEPCVGLSIPQSTRINVVLPAPLSPTRPTISPSRKSTLTSFRARKAPNLRETFLTLMSGGFSWVMVILILP